jgi:hypothetical protein
MTQELFGIIKPRINKRVLEVVHKHLTDEQIGLLIVKLINPYAVFSQQEEAKLRGIDRKTLRGMKSRGELPAEGVNHNNAPSLPKLGQVFPDAGRSRSSVKKPV